MQNKAEIRKAFTEKRKQLSEEEVSVRSEKIKSLFFKSFDLSKEVNIHIFLPILHNKEVDTWTIIEELRKEYRNIGIVISRSKWETFEMENFFFTADTILEKNKLGIPEPVEGDVCLHQDIHMVLLPLIAFDKNGNRIGYGAGFYDRFLANCRTNTVKIGLSLFPPLEEEIEDVNEYDIKIDYCITPDKVYQF